MASSFYKFFPIFSIIDTAIFISQNKLIAPPCNDIVLTRMVGYDMIKKKERYDV